jgi:hypothetical protein
MLDLSLLSPWASAQGELKYELSLAEQTPSNNSIREMHHHDYRRVRQLWCQRVFAALGGRKPKEPIEQAFVVVIRECHGDGLDWDNVYGGLKPLLDCLVCPSDKNPSGLGLIRDDNPKNMPLPPFVVQKSAKRGEGKTTLKIFALNNTQA